MEQKKIVNMKNCFYIITVDDKQYRFQDTEKEKMMKFIIENDVISKVAVEEADVVRSEITAFFMQNFNYNPFEEEPKDVTTISTKEEVETIVDEFGQKMLSDDKLFENQREDVLYYIAAMLSKPGATRASVEEEFYNLIYETQKERKRLQKKAEKFKENLDADEIENFKKGFNEFDNLYNYLIQSFDSFWEDAKIVASNLYGLKVSKEGDLSLDETDELEEQQEFEGDVDNEIDYSKDANEFIPEQKLGNKVKKVLASFETGRKGFFGIPKYHNPKDLFDFVVATIGKNVESPTNIEEFLSFLEQYPESPELTIVAEHFRKNRETHQEELNALISASHLEAVKASFSILEKRETGLSLRFWETSANTLERRIEREWRLAFERSPLIKNVQGDIDKVEVERAYEEYKQLARIKNIRDEKYDERVLNFFKNFGVTLDIKTLVALKKRGFKFYDKTEKTIKYENFFSSDKPTKNYSRNIGRNFFHWLQTVKNKEGTVNILDGENSIYDQISTTIKALVDFEATYNPAGISLTRNSKGRIITDYERQNIFYQKVNALKNRDNDLLEILKEKQFSKNSYLLSLLEDNDEFREFFSHRLVDIGSIKEIEKDFPLFSKIDQISDVDSKLLFKSAFQYTRLRKIKNMFDKIGLPLRTGILPTPTNSDKGRTFMMNTAVYDMNSNIQRFFSVSNLKEDRIKFTKEMREMIFQNLVTPELERIAEHVDNNEKSEAYNKAAKRFNIFPVLNTITVGTEDIPITEYIMENGGIDEETKQKMSDILEEHFINLAKEKSDILAKQELEEGDLEYKGNSNLYDVIENKGIETNDLHNLLLEIEQEVNTQIGYMSFFQVITSDVAQFATGKDFNIDIENKSLIEQNEQISKNILTNVNKRLGSNTASGVLLTNSDNEDYIQLIGKDIEAPAVNLVDIVEYFYGKEIDKKVDPFEFGEEYRGKTYKEVLRQLQEGEDIPKQNVRFLKNKFSNVKSSFDINKTDGQELVTVEETLRGLTGRGKISQKKANGILDKINNQRKALREGKAISTKDKLSLEEKGFLFQPDKPVFSGHSKTEEEIQQYVYVKSSSYTLIPEMTAGTPLDNLRVSLERVQEKAREDGNPMTVRFAFESAVKIGLPTTKIEDPFSETLADEIIGGQYPYLLLPRRYFRMQQDIPDKSSKGVTDISLGTQILKLLFGDGVSELSFDYNGKSVTGEELKKEFFNVFSEILKYDVNELDSRFNKKGKNKTQILRDILLKEADSRGYTKQEKSSFNTIIEEGIETFIIPLMFGPKSDKVESLLLSIVQNTIMKKKVNGFSFVAASEIGFTVGSKESLNEQFSENDTIYLGDKKVGEELKVDEDGYAEVLVPSKFHDSEGNLIDLFENFNGVDGKYIERDPATNSLMIKEDMISPELLKAFNFRIPTSSHSLGTNVKIVGFLPSAAGDIIMVPNTILSQTGSDFDIDKFNVYLDNHIIYPDGRIVINNDKELKKYHEFIGDDLSEKAKKKLAKEKAQNKFFNIYRTVYENKEVLKKVAKPLSTNYTEEQRDKIKNNSPKKEAYFNMFSSQVQQDLLKSGSSGKSAVAVYAKGVTFNSIANQAKKKPIMKGELYNVIISGKKLHDSFGMTEISFGNNSREEFKQRGLPTTISAYLDERVQIAVDNGKLNVLGNVGINTTNAIAVDNYLISKGMAATIEDGEVYDIPFLLHSNPIIKILYKKLEERGIILNNNYNTKSDIVLEIVEKLTGIKYGSVKKAREGLVGTSFDISAKKLYSQIEIESDLETIINSQNTKELQNMAALLIVYSDFIDASKNLKDFTQVIDMTQIGKNFAEFYIKLNAFFNISSKEVDNFDEIFGKFVSNIDEDDPNYKNAVFFEERGYFIPSTPQALLIANSLKKAYEKYYDVHPIFSTQGRKLVNNVLSTSKHKNAGTTAQTQLVKKLFDHSAQFLTASDRLLSEKGDITKKRKEFLIDTKDNISLGAYLQDLKKNENTPLWVKENSFFRALTFNRSSETGITKVELNSSITSNMTEDMIVRGFSELLTRQDLLPMAYNNRDMTTRDLGRFLIDYTFLTGGVVAKSVELYKYIPQEYFDAQKNAYGETIGSVLRSLDVLWNQELDFDGEIGSNSETFLRLEKQFFQNNPTESTKISNKKLVAEDDYFFLRDYDEITLQDMNYIHIRTRKGVRLFRNIGENFYEEITTFDNVSIPEYNFNEDLVESSYYVEEIEKQKKENRQKKIKIEDKNMSYHGKKIKTILKSLEKTDKKEYKPYVRLAKMFLGLYENSTQLKEAVVIEDKKLMGKGEFKNNIIYYNPHMINNDPVATLGVILLETGHHLVYDKIATSYNAETDEFIANEKNPHYEELKDLYNTYRQFKDNLEEITGGYGIDELKEIVSKAEKGDKTAISTIDVVQVNEGVDIRELLHTVSNLHEFTSRVLGAHKETIRALNRMKSENPVTKERTPLINRLMQAFAKLYYNFAKLKGIKIDSESLLKDALVNSLSVVLDKSEGEVVEDNTAPDTDPDADNDGDTDTDTEEEKETNFSEDSFNLFDKQGHVISNQLDEGIDTDEDVDIDECIKI